MTHVPKAVQITRPIRKRIEMLFHCITTGDAVRMNNVSKNATILDLQVKFHRFEKHPIDKTFGCTESHVKLYQYCLENNLPYIVVMEDNSGITPVSLQFSNSTAMDSIRSLIEKTVDTSPRSSDDWPFDVLHLAYLILPGQHYYSTHLPGLYSTDLGSGVRNTTCYIVTNKACAGLVDDFRNGSIKDPIDDHIRFNYRQWITRPYLFNRDPEILSIVNPSFDAVRKTYMGGKIEHFIQDICYGNTQELCIIYILILLYFFTILLFHIRYLKLSSIFNLLKRDNHRLVIIERKDKGVLFRGWTSEQ